MFEIFTIRDSHAIHNMSESHPHGTASTTVVISLKLFIVTEAPCKCMCVHQHHATAHVCHNQFYCTTVLYMRV